MFKLLLKSDEDLTSTEKTKLAKYYPNGNSNKEKWLL